MTALGMTGKLAHSLLQRRPQYAPFVHHSVALCERANPSGLAAGARDVLDPGQLGDDTTIAEGFDDFLSRRLRRAGLGIDDLQIRVTGTHVAAGLLPALNADRPTLQRAIKNQSRALPQLLQPPPIGRRAALARQPDEA